jgi:hydroxyethylthiazole kinase-like uncharacterized protein yjeF
MQIIEIISKLGPRPADAHKGDFGRICIIAGSTGFSGAAALAGRAALRAGAGLVRVATPQSVQPVVAAIEPCYTTIALPADSAGRISAKAAGAIMQAAGENDAVAFGPGVGISSGLRTIIEMLLEQEQLRLVIDADGLNNLAQIINWPENTKANLILTPHPGEMKRLWAGLFREPMPADRQKLAVQFAQRTKSLVVLKGAGTVVTDGEKIYTNKTGNPGMATAGSGDVLTGVIAALLGQGAGGASPILPKLSNFDAAVLGVYTHGLASDIAAQRLGQISLIATDIIDALPQAFSKM